MRTLFLVHILLIALVALLKQAPIGAHSYGLTGYYQDFDTWVQYVHDSCHPEDVEQEDDDEDSGDHLPSRQTKYNDEVFSKWVKIHKNVKPYGYTKKVKSYGGYKKYLPGRHLIEEEEADTPKGASEAQKKSKKSKDKKKDKKKKKEKKIKMPKEKKPKKPKKGPKMEEPPTNFSMPSPPPLSAPSPSPIPNPVPSPPDSPIPTIPNIDDDSVIIVAKDGSGDFMTVQAAIDSVPIDNKKRAVIYVKKGIYREKVLIPSSKPFITLKGENAALTYIQWGDIASTIGKDGKPLSTFGSASVAIEADDFIALDISFKKCHLHSIATPWGSITAQKQQATKENTGYSFAYCMVTGTGTIYLGRSWGAFSRVVYSFTYFDNIIRPEGWNDWNIPSNQQ
ncbi:hypothetical protein L7F22_011051 [Adiantum nelumboides]|nr:hypothetical protein [Adiantum nelumboides]